MRLIHVDTTEARECKNPRCSRTETRLNRHHKGYDSLVGRYNIGIGTRYASFQDCVDLCLECHAIIHYIYEPYVAQWVNRSPNGAKHFRKVLIKVCDDWLAGKLKTPKVPKRYIREFRENYEEWLRNQEKLGTG